MRNAINLHEFANELIMLVRLLDNAVSVEERLMGLKASGHAVDELFIDRQWDRYMNALNDVATMYDIDMAELENDVNDLREAL